MKIPTVEYCCCGCSLRTGTLIIAVLGVIGCVITAIACGLSLVGVLYMLDHPEEKSPAVEKIREVAPVLIAVLASLLIYSLIAFIINCVLLFGTKQNQARLVRIWVIASMVLFFIQLGLVVIEFLYNPQPTVIIHILGFLLQLYYIVVVHSFYKQLCEGGAVGLQ